MLNDERFGDYVIVSQTGAGDQASFVVPVDLRPAGWPASISLPELGPRLGDFADPAFAQAIRVDAERLRERLEARRRRDELSETELYNLPELARIYFQTGRFRKLSAYRRRKNTKSVELILLWSAARGHPDVRTLTEMDVDDFLDRFLGLPAKRLDLRAMWSALFGTARYAGWIHQSPLKRGDWGRPPPKATMLWSAEDVERFSQEACRQGQPGLAGLIRLLFESGQRVGDLRRAEWDKHVLNGTLIIKQSKTGRVVRIPLAQQLIATLSSIRKEASPLLFHDEATGRPFTELTLHQAFAKVREALLRPGDPHLLLKALRHSCVRRLFDTGASVPEIAGVTGHKLNRIHEILECYTPDRHGMAEASIKKAHIARGGSERDFDHVGPMPLIDAYGRRDPSNFFEDPSKKVLERVLGRALPDVCAPAEQAVRDWALVNRAHT